MKTKALFLVCLLLGIAYSQSYAQTWPPEPPSGNQSLTLSMDWPYYTEVYCDGELVDILTGTVTLHCTLHFEDGVYMWGKYSLHGEAIGQDGEVFKIKEKDVEYFPLALYDVHYNLKSNLGNHYIAHITFDFSVEPYIVAVSHAECHEN